MSSRRQFLAAGLLLAASTQSRAQSAIKVRGVYSAPGITYAGLFIATRKGLWEQNGLNAELKQVQGGPLAMAALTNGEADFAGLSSTDPVIGWDKGIKTLTISAFTGALATQFTARNDWLAQKGFSGTTPVEEKIKALKGARVGVSTIGGGPAQYVRYLARSNGFDPETDMKLLPVGFGAPRIAALRANQVDITVGDAPEVDQIEAEGFGTLYLNGATDLTAFREFPYTIASVTPDFAARNPEATRRIARTIGQANDLLYSAFPEVVDLMCQQYPNIDPKVVAHSLQRDRDTFPRGARMTAAMWQNNLTVALATKMIAAPISADEGVLWTNRFNT